jgi:hypothetical protein
VPLQKQPLNINFSQGLNLKPDPFQLPVGQFLALNNSVFTTAGRLTKRNGFANITSVPTAYNSTTLTTLNDNLIATGANLAAYSADTNQWINQGTIQPIQLNTLPLVRISTSQSCQDAAVASNGLVCTTFLDSSGNSFYVVSDSSTGQQVVKMTELPSGSSCSRVFVLGNYFIVTFLNGNDIQYIAIPLINPLNPRTAAVFQSNTNGSTSGYDGVVVGNNLYIAYGATSTSVRIGYLTSSLAASATSSIAASASNLMTVSNDSVRSRIFISFWDSSSTNAYSAAFNYSLVEVMAKTEILSGVPLAEMTSVSSAGVTAVFYETINDYGYDSGIRTDYLSSVTCTLPASGTGTGTVGTPTVIVRSVGLGSKAFTATNGITYMLAAYQSVNQSSYFLIDSLGNVYMRLAYSNGGGYSGNQVLSNVSNLNGEYYLAYLANDFLATANKGTNNPTGTPTSAIYTQTGVNLASFSLNTSQQYHSEIASVLNLTGGLMWQYDGVLPVENNFNVWPDSVEVSTATTGGSITAGTYYYQFCYEWTDNQGNLQRSAPSIPVTVTTTGNTSVNTIEVPTLRLTYKSYPQTASNGLSATNPVRIVGYRWSVAQQVYYQFTSLTSPILNNVGIDYVTITDDNTDADILGNVILYTTGGVIEDIAAPASIAMALFDNRLWLVDAEDQNLLWFSKQVIEDVPVEMSDLLTYYTAPTTSAQGSTGTTTAIYPMDDKLIIFKKDAAYYINGTGPDNTASNSQYPTTPIFITAAVGCAVPNSIVLTPQGLMFQSDKGIWLLGRDLSTNYIGAPVETYNSSTVLSALAIPGTTQVRFILDGGITLMYDYFFNQWATHSNILAISGTLYQGAHTYLNSNFQIFQESVGTFVDGSEPVLLSLTTSWINVAGLQGFERFYFGNLLGTYFTPFTLQCTLSYNYNPSATQAITVTPDNYTQPWGGENVWGAENYGSEQSIQSGSKANVFSARIFPSTQKCQSFQLSIQEVYDPSYGVPAGEGLTLSGLALTVGMKRGYRTQSAVKSFG